MIRLTLLLLGLGLSGCASGVPAPAACHGPFRPANPYGSVLAPAPPAASSSLVKPPAVSGAATLHPCGTIA